jgi:hypothetical protein
VDVGDDLAAEFYVSPLVIRLQLGDHGIALLR